MGFYIVGLKPLPCFGVLVCCSCCFCWRGSWGGNETLPSDGWRKCFISNVIWLLPSRFATVVGVWVCFSAFWTSNTLLFRIILHQRFTILLLFEHELPLIVINFGRVLFILLSCRVPSGRSLVIHWLSPYCALRLVRCYWWSHLSEVIYRNPPYSVNNVRKLSTSPVRRVTPSSGISEVATEWEQPCF